MSEKKYDHQLQERTDEIVRDVAREYYANVKRHGLFKEATDLFTDPENEESLITVLTDSVTMFCLKRNLSTKSLTLSCDHDVVARDVFNKIKEFLGIELPETAVK